MTHKTLVGLRSETNFDLFWIKVNREAKTHDLSEPRLPRNRASASVDHGDALKAHYRQIYFGALDLIKTVSEIRPTGLPELQVSARITGKGC